MEKGKYRGVIFDFDDTLFESREVKWAHHKATAKKFYNIDLSDEDIRLHWGKPMHVLVQKLYKSADTVENLLTTYASLRGDFRKKIYNGSLDAVKFLLDSGVKIGILSAAPRWAVEEDLIKFNFPVDQILVQGSEDTSVHKPDPEVFQPIFAKLKKEGIEKKDIVYVGDSLDDLNAAHAAGIDFIAITTGLYSEEDFKKHGAKIIIKDIREIVAQII